MIPRRTLTAAALAAVALVTTASPVFAAVSLEPDQATQDETAQLTFRVSNDEEDSGTTKLEVFVPTDHPIESVEARQVAGWKVAIDKQRLPKPVQTQDGQIEEAVSKLTWTGGPLNPGEFQEFEVSAGPMPKDVTSLQFKTVQTYANGTVVQWNEPTPPGGKEPEHPVPTLALTPPAPDERGASQGGGTPATTGATAGSPSGAQTGWRA